MNKNIYTNQKYLANNPTWHEEDAPYKVEKILEVIEPFRNDYNRIADIGCGVGEILINLSEILGANKQYNGFDISAEAIAIAKQKNKEHIKFEIKNVNEFSVENSFDLVLVIDVIEHLDNYFEFLQKVSKLSKQVVFHIPLDICVWTLFREKMLIESKERVGHIHNFSEDFILSILNDYGFKVITKIYTEPIYEANSFKEKIIKFSRKILFSINKKFCTKTLGGYSIMVLTETNS